MRVEGQGLAIKDQDSAEVPLEQPGVAGGDVIWHSRPPLCFFIKVSVTPCHNPPSNSFPIKIPAVETRARQGGMKNSCCAAAVGQGMQKHQGQQTDHNIEGVFEVMRRIYLSLSLRQLPLTPKHHLHFRGFAKAFSSLPKSLEH